MCFEWEEQLQMVFNRMDEDKKLVFMALANSHKEDGTGPLLGVQRMNEFGLDLSKMMRNGGLVPKSNSLANPAGMTLTEGQMSTLKPREEPVMYSVTAKYASRMNHRCLFTLVRVQITLIIWPYNCSSNAVFEVFLASFSLQFHCIAWHQSRRRDILLLRRRGCPRRPTLRETRALRFYLGLQRVLMSHTRVGLVARKLDNPYEDVGGPLPHGRGLQSAKRQWPAFGAILRSILEFRRKLREEGLV
jgi:hypothetical protein